MLARLRKDEWIIAIRRKKSNDILADNEDKFVTIPNNWRYWCADPFLFDYNGSIFLLFEMYDRLKGKGKIGYRILKNGNIGKMQLLIEDAGHLSYPYIIKSGNEFFIMPESSSQNIIYSAKLVIKDEKLSLESKKILKKGTFVDTSLLEVNAIKYWFTTEIKCGNNTDNLSIFAENFDTRVNMKGVFNNTNARMGGGFIVEHDSIIRVSQDCSMGYGSALNFSECNIVENCYGEKLIKKVTVDNIKLKKLKKYDGIHTYNSNNEFEVIDLKKSKVLNIVRIMGYILSKLGAIKK